MRPDAVSAYTGNAAVENFEIGGAFFEEDAAGGVVALQSVEAAAVRDLYGLDFDRVCGIDQNREAVDGSGVDA